MPPTLPAVDRIEWLQTFVRIVETGSLSAAAAELGTTQPTVSRRLQALERHFGVRLLNRSTHAIKLTDDGQRCYERAKDILTTWDAFDAELRGTEDEPEGTLRVVVPHALGQSMLMGPLADFLREHARVSVEWLLHDRHPDFVAEGVDCALLVGEVTDPSVVALRLSEIRRIVVASPALAARFPPPTHPRDLAHWPWLALRTYYHHDITLTHTTSGETARVPIRPRLSTDSLYALRHAAVDGLGVGVGSSWMYEADIDRGDLVPVLPGWEAAPLPVHLAYLPTRFQPARLRRFIQAMRLQAPAAMNPARQGSAHRG